METLGDKQRRFARMFALLLHWFHAHGYEVTFPPENLPHKKNSLHFLGLAKDVNLFIGGRYMKTTEAHRPSGEFWESLGGTWGGRFDDGNHYSLEHNGVK